MIERLRWRLRLWAAGKAEHWRNVGVRASLRTRPYRHLRFWRFVDWVSPFTRDGYKRRRLRRLLVTLRYPSNSLTRDVWWNIGERLRKSLGIGPGKFEELDFPTRLKAEFFCDNAELAINETGHTEEFGTFAMEFDLDPPWSRGPEFWVVTIDQQGFVYATQYSALRFADTAFREIDEAYERTMQSIEDELDEVYP